MHGLSPAWKSKKKNKTQESSAQNAFGRLMANPIADKNIHYFMTSFCPPNGDILYFVMCRYIKLEKPT
jgi:hypothetical protein